MSSPQPTNPADAPPPGVGQSNHLSWIIHPGVVDKHTPVMAASRDPLEDVLEVLFVAEDKDVVLGGPRERRGPGGTWGGSLKGGTTIPWGDVTCMLDFLQGGYADDYQCNVINIGSKDHTYGQCHAYQQASVKRPVIRADHKRASGHPRLGPPRGAHDPDHIRLTGRWQPAEH